MSVYGALHFLRIIFMKKHRIEKIKDIQFPLVEGLFLRKDSDLVLIPFHNILFMKADGNYTEIFLHNSNEIFVSSMTLGKIEEKLNCPYLCRTHRSYIVNVNYITGLIFNCIKINKHRIPIGRSYKGIMNSFICI